MARTLAALRSWSRGLKAETMALYFAVRDPRTPLAARLVAAAVVAYALSPIDLIPDFIPVLGYLDDLVLVPLGLMLARRLIPPEIMADARQRAAAVLERPRSYAAAAAIAALWIMLAVLAAVLIHRAA